MRRLISILMLSFIFCSVYAQELTVKSFSVKTGDLSASTEMRRDNNDTPCALVKVLLATNGAQFEPNVIGAVANKTNEYWVYLPAGSKHLKVKHQSYIPKDVVFEDYGIHYLESKTTYELVMSIPSDVPTKKVVTSQYLIFNVEPKDAVVTVNGEVWSNNNGIARKFVPFGNYEYRVEAKMYHPETGRVEVNDPNNKVQVTSSLKPAFGYISISSEGSLSGATIYIDNELVGKAPLTSKPLASGSHTVMAVKPLYKSQAQTVTVQDGRINHVVPVMKVDYSTITLTVANNAEIWVNGERKGVGKWTGDMASGEYMIETRLANHRSVSTTKHISMIEPYQSFTLEAPKPIYGSINISTTPDMANVYIDGKLVGQTPLFLQECLIGKHDVRVSKDGYGDYTQSVTINEAQMLEVGGALSNIINVTLSCNVSGAELYVDGKAMGVPSNVSRLACGYHEIRLKANGFQEYVKTIEISQTKHKFDFEMSIDENYKPEFTVKGIWFRMVPVRGGTFQMGSALDKDAALHTVTLSDYYIGETEVTQDLWEAIMGSNPSYHKGASWPVERVSWSDCQQFVKTLNAITGQTFRMPTEAEWEYAARGGSKRRNLAYSGSDSYKEVAWTKDNSGGKTHSVKTKKPNELGVYDMSGNVWEWCQDWYGLYETKSVNSKNPTGVKSGSERVLRGGAYSAIEDCKVNNRFKKSPGSKFIDLGLRLVLSDVKK